MAPRALCPFSRRWSEGKIFLGGAGALFGSDGSGSTVWLPVWSLKHHQREQDEGPQGSTWAAFDSFRSRN